VGSSWRRDGLIVESAILLFALTVALWLAEDRRRIRIVLRAAIVTGGAASLYGIAQYFGWDPFLPSKAYQAGEGIFTIVRPPATFGHADYFANWLVIVAFLALAAWDDEWKTIARITIALATLAIILSGTRSAMLGLLAGALLFAVIARPAINRRTTMVLMAAAACMALFYISPAGEKLRARVHWSRDDVRGGARLLLWRDSLRMAMRHPVLGFGPETFTAQFPPFESVELSRAYPDFYHESPHNMFLDALVSQGIPGAVALLALCAFALWTARKSAALAAALLAAIVCQQFMVLTIPTALYFYLLIAIIVGQVPGLSPAKGGSLSWPTIPIAAAISLVFLLFGTRLLIADHATAVAEHQAQFGNVPAAAEAYHTARRWQLQPGEFDLRYSQAMTRLAATTNVFATSVAAAQQAAESAIYATETSEDRQNAWYNYATIAALRNNAGDVETGLRRAIDCAPNWFKPHWTLSQFLELTGRHAEARREASVAMDLDGGHDTEVTATSRNILSRP
jgi:O-antigen ligase